MASVLRGGGGSNITFLQRIALGTHLATCSFDADLESPRSPKIRESHMTTKIPATPDTQQRIDELAARAKVAVDKAVDKVSEAAHDAVAKTNVAVEGAAKATTDKAHEVSKYVGEKLEEAGKKLEDAGKKMGA